VTPLSLHAFHLGLNARFTEVHDMEVVDHYGEALAEHSAFRESAGVLDLSFRSRLCLTGTDGRRFLNGQVTNNVKDLKAGEGCYAALLTAKGKMQSDLNIYCLPEVFLLDFEPGLSRAIADRLEKYIIADDVQVVDMAPHYGLLSVQGPKSSAVVSTLRPGFEPRGRPMEFSAASVPGIGEIYCMNQPRGAVAGFDLFVPAAALSAVAEQLITTAKEVGGRACGWQALEMLRIEAGIPRFGADMDETNLPPEAGLEGRAISYSKGCYIGQEVMARIRTYGQVAKSLCGLLLPDVLDALPRKGDKLVHGDKEAGYITSALASPALGRNIALGYVRRECHQPGSELKVRCAGGDQAATVVGLPFQAGRRERRATDHP